MSTCPRTQNPITLHGIPSQSVGTPARMQHRNRQAFGPRRIRDCTRPHARPPFWFHFGVHRVKLYTCQVDAKGRQSRFPHAPAPERAPSPRQPMVFHIGCVLTLSIHKFASIRCVLLWTPRKGAIGYIIVISLPRFDLVYLLACFAMQTNQRKLGLACFLSTTHVRHAHGVVTRTPCPLCHNG